MIPDIFYYQHKIKAFFFQKKNINDINGQFIHFLNSNLVPNTFLHRHGLFN